MKFLFTTMAYLVLLTACDGEPTELDAGPVASDASMSGSDAGASDAGMGTDAAVLLDATPVSDTWDSWASGFFMTYCTECHAGGRRNYTTIDEVRRDVDRITCGTSAVMEAGCGTFPPPRQFPVGDGPFPDDEERARLIAWLNAGLPE